MRRDHLHTRSRGDARGTGHERVREGAPLCRVQVPAPRKVLFVASGCHDQPRWHRVHAAALKPQLRGRDVARQAERRSKRHVPDLAHDDRNDLHRGGQGAAQGVRQRRNECSRCRARGAATPAGECHVHERRRQDQKVGLDRLQCGRSDAEVERRRPDAQIHTLACIRSADEAFGRAGEEGLFDAVPTAHGGRAAERNGDPTNAGSGGAQRGHAQPRARTQAIQRGPRGGEAHHRDDGQAGGRAEGTGAGERGGGRARCRRAWC